MGFPSALSASTSPRVYLARIPEGNTLPTAYTFDSDDAEAAGSTAITLSLTTVDGGAASGTVYLEHDQPILMPADASTHPLAINGTFSVGDYVIKVDDGGVPALPTDNIAVGDYFTIAGDDTLYRVVERTADGTDYVLRIFPSLRGAPADDAVVTQYNVVRLNLASGTQYVEIDTTGVAVTVTGVTYAMASATTSRTTYAFRQLLGIESANPTTSVETTDVATNTLTTTLKGTTSFEVAVEGIRIPGDAAAREILMPFLLPFGTDDRSAESIYTRYESSDQAYVAEGPGSITEADGGETVNEAATYSFTMSVSVGDNLGYWVR